MVTNEENMINLRYTKTIFTIGDNVIFTEKKCLDWHGYHKHNIKIHFVALYDTARIPGLHKTVFSMTQSLQKFFQIM